MATTAAVSTANLASYLSDHMAGSAGGVQLAEKMVEENPGIPFFQTLLADIKKDQDVLERIMDQMGASESSLKKAGALAAEKVGTAISGSGSAEDLGVLREAEVLTAGITAKLSLWNALDEISDADERLASFDFQSLIAAARAQLDGLQEQHRKLSRKALLR
jgi:hypothetical protein